MEDADDEGTRRLKNWTNWRKRMTKKGLEG
jgi:hypothetical protein